MLRQTSFHSPSRPARDAYRWATLRLACIPLASLVAAIAIFLDHWRSEASLAPRATSGIVLIMMAMLQAKMVSRASRRGRSSDPLALYRQAARGRWIFVGLVVCYSVSVCLGAEAGARYVFAAGLSVWYTLALVPLVAEGRVWRHLASAAQAPWMRRFGRLGFAVAILLPAVEIGLRLYDLVADRQVVHRFVLHSRTFTPGAVWHGRQVNRSGYCDDDFHVRRSPGMFRLATLGNAAILGGDRRTNCIDQLERLLAGVEVYQFALREAGPREYVAQLAEDVGRYRPDLVLAFLSVGTDLSAMPATRGVFDWQGLRICQWSAAALWSPGEQTASPQSPGVDEYETFLRREGELLKICRTPITAKMQARWQATLQELDALVVTSARQRTPLAFVLVPCAFQVDRRLCRRLCRRLGCDEKDIDLELPQRRLAQFADQHEIPTFDLLPRLRASETTPYVRHADGWNERGNRVVARALSQWLSAQFGTLLVGSPGTSQPNHIPAIRRPVASAQHESQASLPITR